MSTDYVQWKGTPLDCLETSFNKSLTPDVKPSVSHTVLIKLPIIEGRVPQPYPIIGDVIDTSNNDYVLLPFSSQCFESVSKNDKKKKWEVVIESLQNSITNGDQLLSAISLYNHKYVKRWNFTALHTFFNENCDEYEREIFFESLLPKMISLALQLPNLVTGKIPLLKQNCNRSITLSQIQVASLLTNAFFCTFPMRFNIEKKNRDDSYPDINFNNLFNFSESTRASCIQEKLKCLTNYFRRVTDQAPDGVITYSRHVIQEYKLPDWINSKRPFTRIHVTKKGTIEDDGYGMLQMDFADKFVGGGVIGRGCVQEEIRFVICPELIISRLFTQRLDAREVLVVTGCERYNKYKGYGKSFTFDGNFIDHTPKDKYGRKHCTVIAVDALSFSRNPAAQYTSSNILRELNKVYVGFSWGKFRESDVVSAVASGNWGCGVFRGDVCLKSLLQIMACSQVGRDLVYFTFGNEKTTKSIYEMHSMLKDNQQTVGDVWKILCKFSEEGHYKNCNITKFVREQLNNSKKGFVFRKVEYLPKMVKEAQTTINSNSMENLDKSFLNSEQLAQTLKIVDDLCTARNVTLNNNNNTESEKGESNFNIMKMEEEEEGRRNFENKSNINKQKDSWNRLRESRKDFHKPEGVNRCNILDRLEEQDDFTKLIKKTEKYEFNPKTGHRKSNLNESSEFGYLKKMYNRVDKTKEEEERNDKYEERKEEGKNDKYKERKEKEEKIDKYKEIKEKKEKTDKFKKTEEEEEKTNKYEETEKEVRVANGNIIIENQEKGRKIVKESSLADFRSWKYDPKENNKMKENENVPNEEKTIKVEEIKRKEINTNEDKGQLLFQTKKRKISDYFPSTPKNEKQHKKSIYFSNSKKGK